MPSSAVGSSTGSPDQQSLSATGASGLLSNLDVLTPGLVQKSAALSSVGVWPTMGPCPCFGWLGSAGRPAITDREDVQLAEAQSWDNKYKQLWLDSTYTGRRRKTQRAAPEDSKLSITFGHNDTSKHWGGISAVAICPTTNDVYTGSRDCCIKRWTESRSSSSRGPQTLPAIYAASTSHPPLSLVNTHDLSEHTGWVSALVATRELIVSASYDTTVRLWSPDDCRHLGDLIDTHTDYVLRISVAPRSRRLVSAGLRGHLHVWDLENMAMVARHGSSNSNKLDASMGRYGEEGSGRGGAGGDGGIRPLQGGCVNSGSVYALDCTPDANIIAFNGPEGLIRLYDTRAGPNNCSVLRGHTDNVRDLRISRDGHRLVSASSDKCLRVWDARAPARCMAAVRLHDDAAWALAAADEELNMVYSGGRDGSVFLADTRALTASPITKVDSPVLSLTPDHHRSLLWVSTPSSSLGAWPLPTAAPTDPAPSVDLSGSSPRRGRAPGTPTGGPGSARASPDGRNAANQCANPLEPPSMPSVQTPTGLLRSLSMPHNGIPAPAVPPSMWLDGTPPVVRCASFENRRHLLTKDSAGVVALWDLVYGKPVKLYHPSKGKTFEDIYKDLFIQFLASVPPWFTLDINQGVLTIHLSKSSPSAFAAEIYGVTLGEDVRDDFKYNFGQHLLNAVLESLRCKAHGRQDLEAYVKREGPFAFYKDPAVNPILSATRPHSTLRWRLAMRKFTGDELQQGILPAWVHDTVMRGKIPPMPQTHKVSFTLEPVGALRSHMSLSTARNQSAGRGPDGGGAPGLSYGGAPERLTAPIILEIRKVAHYVQTRLDEAGLRVSIPQITFDPRANLAAAAEAGQEPHVAILHDGRLLPWEISLNTVRRFLCSGRVTDDIPLQYVIVEWARPPPIADLVPKKIDPEG